MRGGEKVRLTAAGGGEHTSQPACQEQDQCQFQRRTVQEFAKNGHHLTMGRDWQPETPPDP